MARLETSDAPTVHVGSGVVEGTGNGDDGDADRRSELRYGRRLEVRRPPEGPEEIRLESAGGRVELSITLTEAGPVLHFEAAGIRLTSAGAVEVDCEDFRVNARGNIHQRTDGDLLQSAAGDAELRARCCEVHARRGDVRIWANDDVRLNGERIKLNC